MIKKPLYVAIPYLLGMLVYYNLQKSQYIPYIIVCTVVLGVLLFKVFKLSIKQSVLCVTSCIVGVFVYANYIVTTQDVLLAYSGYTVEYSGHIVELKDYSNDKSCYVLKGSIGDTTDAKLLVYTNSLECSYGDVLTLECTVKGFNNEYLFNSKDYYSSKGIYLQADDILSLNLKPCTNVVYSTISKLHNYRNDVVSTFKLNMSKQGSALLSAILFGDKSGLQDRDSLIRSGIGHVIAVSGLHLTILLSFIDIVLLLIGRRIEVPIILRYLIYELFMIAFIVVVDFPISAVRTFIMLTINKSSVLFVRKHDTLNTLCITCLVMLTLEPYLIHNVSFLLSISGVFGIGVLAPYVTKEFKTSNKILRSLVALMCATLSVFPVSMVYFDEVSIVSPISNLVLIPLCEVALICGFVVFVLGGKCLILSKSLLIVADYCCKLTIAISNVISKVWITNVPTGYTVPKYVVLLMILLIVASMGMFKDRSNLIKNILTSILTVAIVLCCTKVYQSSTLKVAILGSSKDTAIVITYHNDTNVIDCSKNSNTAKYVRKYLKSYGINSITSLTFTNIAYQSITTYNQYLKDYRVTSVNLLEGTHYKSGYTVLGVSPNMTNKDATEYVYHYGTIDVTISVDGSVTINNGISVQSFELNEHNIVIEYHNNGLFKVRRLVCE